MGGWAGAARDTGHRNRLLAVTITREQEIWGIALWVEKNHGQLGAKFIAEQIGRLAVSGEAEGIRLWTEVARRFDKLRPESTDCTRS